MQNYTRTSGEDHQYPPFRCSVVIDHGLGLEHFPHGTNLGVHISGRKGCKTTLETSGKDAKTTLETSGKDVKTTLETS